MGHWQRLMIDYHSLNVVPSFLFPSHPLHPLISSPIPYSLDLVVCLTPTTPLHRGDVTLYCLGEINLETSVINFSHTCRPWLQLHVCQGVCSYRSDCYYSFTFQFNLGYIYIFFLYNNFSIKFMFRPYEASYQLLFHVCLTCGS